MSVKGRYRVTYSAPAGDWAARIKLSEVIEAEDLEDALAQVKDWARRQKWIPIAIEELEE